jgi:hypothetical protein
MRGEGADVWKLRHAFARVLLAIPLCLAATGVRAQSPRRPYLYRETWYEALLNKWNPSNVDYGRWFEERRRAFLEATVNQPQFWYSLIVTVWSVFLMAAYAKLLLDNRRRMRVTEEIMADVYSHDLYSREIAKEAIERHNQHIEKCNRAVETSEGVDGRPGWGETHTDRLKAELQRVATQMEATTQERNKLQEELRQKSLIVSDLSLRLDALSKKVNGAGHSGRSANAAQSAGENGDGVELVGHINRLQEELYAERQKNKRLKGS